MGVVDVAVRILDNPSNIKLENDILGGNPRGLISQRLAVNPDNPQEGRLWTQWNSVEDARAFAERLKAAPPDSKVRATGEAAILTDPQYLKKGS